MLHIFLYTANADMPDMSQVLMSYQGFHTFMFHHVPSLIKSIHMYYRKGIQMWNISRLTTIHITCLVHCPVCWYLDSTVPETNGSPHPKLPKLGGFPQHPNRWKTRTLERRVNMMLVDQTDTFEVHVLWCLKFLFCGRWLVIMNQVIQSDLFIP